MLLLAATRPLIYAADIFTLSALLCHATALIRATIAQQRVFAATIRCAPRRYCRRAKERYVLPRVALLFHV